MKKSMLIFAVLLFSMSVIGWTWYPQEKPNQPETMSLVPMMQQLLEDIQQVDR